MHQGKLYQEDVSDPYHQAGHPNPTQTWTDVVPHPDAPASDLLTHSQLQEEERDANDEEEDEVWNQIGTWITGRYIVELLQYMERGV